MRNRSDWKRHAAEVGQQALNGKPSDKYPQAYAAVELWARDQLKDGFNRYQSPCAKEQAYGTVTARGADEYNEISEAVSAALVTLTEETLAVLRAEHLGLFNIGNQFIRIPTWYTRSRIARKYFGQDESWYDNRRSIGYAKVAEKMGLDGL